MKKITFILLYILTNFGVQAQTNQQTLLNNTWFLAKIEVDDEMIFPPFEESTEYSSFQHFQNDGNISFSQGQCMNGAGGSYAFLTENTLHISQFAVTAMMCPNLDLEIFFATLNTDVFWNNMEFDFQYTITSENDLLQLVLTGANGNKAFYYNEATANTKSFNGQLLKIYPNPSTDFLNVSIGNLDKILIFDIQGKRIETKFNTNAQETQIDIQHLAKGNYILQISKDNQTESLKFIKK
ncbi:T9SS type A sorting domain-containing protein [Flavobacterium sp. I3-2]|uniref:T9SS type A sorting domain-containing protein n=1 Tax=Flavobacterium sp. I3-2 TaxID=2748319 RepID=UPI0015AFD830|nr:T9SS type A sorting domain-containing protein [Flavobacterium sp. I3-2]